MRITIWTLMKFKINDYDIIFPKSRVNYFNLGIRKCVGIAKAKGMKMFEKFKERKGANEADKKEN